MAASRLYLSHVVLFLTLLVAGASAGNYFIAAPRNIQRGSSYDITVDIVNGTDVEVEATLLNQVYNSQTGRYDLTVLKNVSGVFNQGQTDVLSIEIEPSFQCPSCRLNIRGRGGLQFEKVIYPYVNYNVVVIFVQSDKGIYKPGQTVQYRVFAVYPDLKLYNGNFNVEIYDPSNNKIEVFYDVSNETGVVEQSLVLSQQPVFGTWSINVAATQTPDRFTQTFVVQNYDLPKFEVQIELPPYGLTSDTVLEGTVKATYTFGQPVIGSVELHVGPNRGPDYCGKLPATTQKGFKINGEAQFSFTKADIQRSVSIYELVQVKVTAFVTEATTGIRLNGSSLITYYGNRYTIKFLENTPSSFKPGVPYQAFLQVTSPDGKPPITAATVRVFTYGSYAYSVPDQSFYGIYQFSGTMPVSARTYNLPSNGVLTVDLDIPTNITSLYISAIYSNSNVRTARSISKMNSPSNNYIQLTLLGKNVQSNTEVQVKVDGTEPMGIVSYKVLSRGRVASSGTVDGEGQKSFVFSLVVTPAMGPTAHLLVYSFRTANEIMVDSLAFNVNDIYDNRVSISFGRNESQPHETESITVKAEQFSVVKVLAVDQSVLLMKTGNDLTSDKVQDAVYRFDTGSRPSSSEYALSISSSSISSILNNVGLLVMTDITLDGQPPVYYPPSPSSPAIYEYETPGAPEPEMGYPGSPQAPGAPSVEYPPQPPPGGVLQEVQRVREYFPETWLWETRIITSDSGEVEFEVEVPDTITSWVANAFAVHSIKGLGVATTPAKLQVFRQFFVSLTYPSSAIRGEQVIVQATVFNYLSEDLKVTVTLKCSSSFQSVQIKVDDFNKVTESYLDGDQTVVVTVKSQEQGVAYFPIQLTTIGIVNVEVSARSSLAADAERRSITVRSEGAPVSYNYPFFIQLSGNSRDGQYNNNISFPSPKSAVPDSAEVKVTVTGDLIGPSLKDIRNLLRLPTGCGEQSLMASASNVYIARYLDSTSSLTDALRKYVVDILKDGYQRQLTYQRYDGSFSAFGNSDDTGSTWLTAYVVGVFTKALDFTFVDKNLLTRGLDWIVDRQNKDGSFNEFGRVLDRQTQGTGSGPQLTAFVALSLLSWDKVVSPSTCTANNANCYRVYRYGNATQNAIHNLESLVTSNSIKKTFVRAIVAYALTLAKSPKAQVILGQLEDQGIREGGHLYWQDSTTEEESSRYISWTPARIQPKTIDILTTAYASLAFTGQGRIEDALPSVRWLIAQRNANGGFLSTQDTVVGLQALSEYATASHRPDTDLHIEVSANGDTTEFSVNNDNALTLQVQELEGTVTDASIVANGRGLALVGIEHNFFVTSDLTTPSFEITSVILDENVNSFNLMVCSRWLWKRETGMVVQETSIPSGFQPDLSQLRSVAGLRRSEIKGDIIAIYFDQLSQATICYTISFSRVGKVARSQPGYIVTYDYYQPSDRATSFYLPRSLQKATVCDVGAAICSAQEDSTTTPVATTPFYVVDPIYDGGYTTAETPVYPDTPVVETPVYPDTPVVETPVYPDTPVVETPVYPDTPVVETPVYPDTPVVETPVYPDTLVRESPVNPDTPAPESPVNPDTPVPESPVNPDTPVPESPVNPDTPIPESSAVQVTTPFIGGGPPERFEITTLPPTTTLEPVTSDTPVPESSAVQVTTPYIGGGPPVPTTTVEPVPSTTVEPVPVTASRRKRSKLTKRPKRTKRPKSSRRPRRSF